MVPEDPRQPDQTDVPTLLALESARAGTFDLPMHAGEMPSVSTGALAIFGFAAPETPSIADFVARVHPTDRAMVETTIERSVQEGKGHVVEYRVLRPDDTVVWVMSRAEVVLGADGRVDRLVGALIDVTDRRWAEDRARSQASLLDAVDEGVIATDRNGSITFWNRYAESLFGWTPTEMVGARALDVLRMGDGSPVPRTVVSAVEQGARWEGEIALRRKDGSSFVAFVSASPLQIDGEVVGAVALARDISERAQERLRLQTNEAFTTRVLDSLFAFVGVLEVDGTVLRANRAPLAAAGLTPDDVIGKKFWDCYWWDYAAGVQQQLRDAVANAARGEVVRYDVEVRMAGESRMWIDFQIAPLRDDDGTITHLVPSAMDISGRRAVAAALAESEERFRRIADELPLLVWLHDAEGRQEFVNQTFRDYFAAPQDLGEAGWLQLVHPDDVGPYAAEFGRCLAAHAPFHAEVRVRRGDGHWRWVESWGRPRFDPDGRFLGMVGTSADITDRKEAEAALRVVAIAERRARERAELITSVLSELQAVDGLQARAQRLVDVLASRLADYATVESPGADEPVLAIAHRDPEAAGVLSQLRRSHRLSADHPHSLVHAARGVTQFLPEVTSELRRSFANDDQAAALLDRLGTRSHLAVPLQVGHRELGVLTVGITDHNRTPFDRDDLELVTDIADRAGVLLGRARLFEQEHQTALRLQRALLPSCVRQHPSVDVAARYTAATAALEVGGDWYDVLELPDGRMFFTVGDVVGHSIEAATAMGRLRTGIAALARRAAGPAQLLAALDEFASADDVTDFATACFLALDPATGELQYTTAGHPPALVVEPDGAVRWLEEARSRPIGLSRPSRRQQATTILAPGSLLVLYSDGLVEDRWRDLDAGMAALARVAVAASRLPVDELCDRLLERVPRSSGGEDDMVVMCARLATDIRQRFHRRVLAQTEQLAPLRAALRSWLDAAAVGQDDRERVLLAVDEGAANSIEHGYQWGAFDTVEVDVHLAGDQLDVEIRDSGVGRERRFPEPDRGMGTPVMQAVAEGFARDSSASGTTVRFSVRLDRERRP